ncbi:glutamate 5-kinase, partial [Vibrio campbellii]
MISTQQQEIALKKQTIVVKLGTSVLTGGTQALDRAHMVELVRQCAQLK